MADGGRREAEAGAAREAGFQAIDAGDFTEQVIVIHHVDFFRAGAKGA